MIPKILHFIWFGNTIPKYVQHCIDAFKKVNQDFDIHFVMRTITEIEKIYDNNNIQNEDDKMLYSCISNILTAADKYVNTIRHCNKAKLRFIQALSDIFRLELINHYGGIYLDCDTFPLKKFDEKLLNNSKFSVLRHTTNNFITPDNYFIGAAKDLDIDDKLWEIYDLSKIEKNYKLIQTDMNWWKSLKYIQYKKKFIDCTLNIGQKFSYSDFYIDHYAIRSWKDNGNGIQTPLCKYDIQYSKIL